MSELTSRERFRRMLERRDHDRIPRSDAYWPETIARWQREGLNGSIDAAHEILRCDTAPGASGVYWSWPVPYPGRHEMVSEDAETQVVRGNQGKIERVWKNRSGTPEHIAFGCDCREKWEREFKPALWRAPFTTRPDDSRKSFDRQRRAGRFTTLQGHESFEDMRQLVGDAILLAAFAEDPEWVRDMSRTYTDLILREFSAALDAGVEADGVWVFGDIGYKSGTFFSPRMYRDLLWPDHKRLCDWAHAHGMKFIYHSDGDVRKFLDLFVEGGFDCIQPLEAKAHMDVRELAPTYGSRLSFFGNVDMTVAITGDRDRLEHEVKTKLAAGMANKGYAYHSDHSVPPQVSWETYQFIIELVDRYGSYGSC